MGTTGPIPEVRARRSFQESRREAIWEFVSPLFGALTTGAMFCFGVRFLVSPQWPLGSVLFIVGLWRFALWTTREQNKESQDIRAELECSTTMRVLLDIGGLVEGPHLDALFARLQAVNRIPAGVSLADWRARLLATFGSRNPGLRADRPLAEVHFGFQGGEITVNDTPKGQRLIEYRLLIPDDAFEQPAFGIPRSEDERFSGLVIRLVVVSGVLWLQLGEWTEANGLKPHGSEGLAWDTIASYPLLLDCLAHRLPPRYLLLDFLTEAFEQIGMTRPGTEFSRRIDEYRLLLSPHARGDKVDRAMRLHARLLKEWLKAEGTGADAESSDFGTWVGPYMHVHISCARTLPELNVAIAHMGKYDDFEDY